jgi:hypothetical protein
MISQKRDHLGYFAFVKRTPWVLVTEVEPLLSEARPHPEQDNLRRHGAGVQAGQTRAKNTQDYALSQARFHP